jgi:peptide-methionine (S)-S-oxide reductase
MKGLISFPLFLLLFLNSGCSQTTTKQGIKTSSADKKIETMEGLEIATLGAGCFWCVEAIFQDMKGVLKVESGYAGGEKENPTYKEVCEGTTGHAEVVQVTFDPKIISYAEILELFFAAHDPTTLNRQGGDVGTQYRSAIFYHNENQKEIAKKSLQEALPEFEKPIVTEITAYSNYYPAENYHQDYYNLNADKNPYCSSVIAPKLAKFRKKYADKLKN